MVTHHGRKSKLYHSSNHAENFSRTVIYLKRIACAGVILLLLLSGCAAPSTVLIPAETMGQRLLEFSFSAEAVPGENAGQWELVYTYNGEIIDSGHRFLFSQEVFAFHSVQVEIIEKNAPSNRYSATFSVAICDGGSGKTELTVTASDGTTAIFKISCHVGRI